MAHGILTTKLTMMSALPFATCRPAKKSASSRWKARKSAC